jgi:hypothetical protein
MVIYFRDIGASLALSLQTLYRVLEANGATAPSYNFEGHRLSNTHKG